AGTAGIAVENVRIAALTTDAAKTARALIAPEVGPLAQVRLADDDRARIAQPLRDRRILARWLAHQCQRARSGLLAIAGVDVVFQQNRNAVQRTALPLMPTLFVELPRDAARVGIELDDRIQVESPVDQLNPAQIDVEQLLRAQLPARHQRLHLPDARERDVVMTQAERGNVLSGCIAGLRTSARQRREGRSPRSPCARLQKGA